MEAQPGDTAPVANGVERNRFAAGYLSAFLDLVSRTPSNFKGWQYAQDLEEMSNHGFGSDLKATKQVIAGAIAILLAMP